MKKKLISLLLASSMLATCLAGCGAKENSGKSSEESKVAQESTQSQSAESSTETSEPEKKPLEALTLPLVSEPTTITLGVPDFDNVEDYETNAYTLWIEEQTGVNLEFVFFPNHTEESLQQFTLMATGNEELPDILIGQHGWQVQSVYELGEQGYFIDLTELIEYYAPTYKAQMALQSENVQARVNAIGVNPTDGKRYGMPYIAAPSYDTAQSTMWINQVWLDKLGLKAPTTIEELYDVLEAFATKDPNGNGKLDEIPMVGMPSAITGYITNAYVYANFYQYASYWMNVDDNGKLYSVYTSDAYREALKVMADMTEKGYINTLTYTLEQWADLKNLTTNPATTESIVGMFAGNPVLSTNKGDARFLEYEVSPALEAEMEGGGYYVINPATIYWSTFITKDCENPELAMQLIDFFFTDEACTRSRHGVLGTDWDFVEGTSFETAEVGDRIIDTSMLQGNAMTEGNRTWGGRTMVGSLFSKNFTAALIDSDDVWQNHSNKLTAPLRSGVFTNPTPANVIDELVYTAEETEVVSASKDLLNQFFREARAQFATGVKDPNKDADWEAYLKDAESAGLSEFLKCSQAAYDRMNAK